MMKQNSFVKDKKKVKDANILVSCLVAFILLLIAYDELIAFKPINTIVCLICAAAAVFISLKRLGDAELLLLRTIMQTMVAVWVWCVLLSVVQGANKPLRLRELEFLLLGGLMVFLFCKTRLSVRLLYLAYYIICIFFYYQYFIVGVQSYGVMDRESGAINTILLLSFSIAIQIVDYRNNHRIALLPSFIILPIAVMSWNRTGLFADIVYIVTVSFIGTSKMRKTNMRFLLYFALSVFFVFVFVRFYNWFEESLIYTKIVEQGIDNSARSSIWKDYFSSMGVFYFLFGKPIDEGHLLLGEFANAHNSFIMLHSQTGFIAFLFMWVVVKTLVTYWKSDKFVFILFMILILRCFFDMAFFFQPFDFAFYMFIVGKKELTCNQGDVRVSII